eukprot:CAMPEP_0203668022 /NCGR_PEP_ID=MMETSP0090-20130426/4734_1 /ASSEMBLY_ACC=CAM_ASM_001088 /TAXON_ID=426623 /ORGANISM="Chaetoceros affinis, Strain CCMP159" /LENGTH=262 /DNA_ID=CAMNT_0050532337 /DNA_START=26 /DNA_END=817 /DNA_ORIENTATION=-
MVSTASITLALTVLVASLSQSSSFSLGKVSLTSTKCNPLETSSLALYAKKKSRKNSGQGFGKAPKVESSPKSAQNTATAVNPTSFNDQEIGGLSSIESTNPASFSRPQIELDPNLSTDERNKEILKQKYGLRSFEEQQGDIKAAEKIAENRKRMQKIKQMKDEEFDIFMVIPPPLIKGIDFFLKAGLTITTILFILAGVGITAEAWAVATGNTLPENVDTFIVNVIEPNFTPGLFVLLGFSVSLGLFATAQLGSGSSTYKEQ